MIGKDYEFIREIPPEAPEELSGELTGWETIIFELMDDQDDEE